MKTNVDYVLVKVESALNDFLAVIKDDQGNDIKLVVNPNWRPTHNARICGEVIAVPGYLSGMDTPLHEIYPGSPKPLMYRSHDHINQQLELMPPKYRKTANVPYSCGKYVPEFQTHQGAPVEVPVGSNVYFHYNSLLNEENFLFQEESGDLVYRIHYSQIFCYVQQGEITAVNNYVLVTPFFDGPADKIEVNGFPVFGKMKGNLVTELNSKPKYLTGMVQFISKGIGSDLRDTPSGTLVMFRPSSEFRNTIEGVDFFVMQHNDLVAEWLSESEMEVANEMAKANGVMIEFNPIIPIGDYVSIKAQQQDISNKLTTHIFDPHADSQDFKPGEIFVLDRTIAKTKKKKFHNFGIGEVTSQGNLCRKNYIGHTVIFERSSYYLYDEEHDLVFVRYGDIYGDLTSTESK